MKLTPARPAETSGAAAAIGTLLAIIFGVSDTSVIAALVVVVGTLPAVVSLLISNGGVRGVARRLWYGHGQQLTAPVTESRAADLLRGPRRG